MKSSFNFYSATAKWIECILKTVWICAREGKYDFLKNWCFTLIWGVLCAFLVLYWKCDRGITSKRYFGHWFLYTLKRRHSFLHHRLCWRDSKPSSWYIFSLDVPLMAPLIAKAALYCRDSILWWKKLLKAWS